MSEEANETNEENNGSSDENQNSDTENQGDQDNSTDQVGKSEDGSERDKPDPRKPEWMSDTVFKDNFAKTEGELDMGEVAKWYSESYNNSQKALHTRKDVLSKDIADEIEAKRLEHRPETAADYEFKGSEALGLDVELADDDPTLSTYRAWAFEKGFSQEQFDEALDMHFQGVSAFFPDWEVEKEKLGENADARAAHLNTWLSKVLSPESYKAAESLALDAEKIILLEELSELSGNVSFSKGDGVPSNTGMTRAEVLSLMDSDEYRNGDPATLQKVQSAWKRITN